MVHDSVFCMPFGILGKVENYAGRQKKNRFIYRNASAIDFILNIVATIKPTIYVYHALY